jgi:hypothetical protein
VASRIVARTPRTIVALSFVRDDRPEQQATENAGRDARAVVTAMIVMLVATTAITLTNPTIVLLAAAAASNLPLDAEVLLTARPLAVLLVSAIRILHLANQALHFDQRRPVAKLRSNDEALERTGWRGRGGRDKQAGAKQC